MDQERLRNYCLSLPGVTEKMPFGAFKAAQNILAFYVDGHIFCYFDIEKFDAITLKSLQPDELAARYAAVERPYNMSRRYWFGIRPNEDADDEALLELVRQSYEIVGRKKAK